MNTIRSSAASTIPPTAITCIGRPRLRFVAHSIASPIAAPAPTPASSAIASSRKFARLLGGRMSAPTKPSGSATITAATTART